MPMMPGPIAAVSYAAVKIIGYAFFAKRLNATLKQSVSPYGFGWGKTGIGLVGGLIYLFVIVPRLGGESSDWVLFLGAAPIRITAWGIALSVFYRLHQKPRIFMLTILAGLLWTYFLDGIMWAVYQFVPGMTMPLC
jgi:hypothetical protein